MHTGAAISRYHSHFLTRAAEYRPDKVKKLVYVCAFLLRDGETLCSRGGGRHDPLNAPYEVLRKPFMVTCPDEEVRRARELLVAEPSSIGATPIHITEVNYGRLPRVYIECLRDNAIKPSAQKQMYTDTPCERVFTMDTSHSPFLAAPEELAGNLLAALTV